MSGRLVEALILVFVLSVALGSAVSLSGIAAAVANRTDIKSQAMMAARIQMEDLRTRSNLQQGTTSWQPYDFPKLGYGITTVTPGPSGTYELTVRVYSKSGALVYETKSASKSK